MKIEHVAVQVEDPQAMAAWYRDHLGFSIKRALDTPPYMHFIADSSGSVMLELYRNEAVPLPDYRKQNALVVHIAFIAESVTTERDRLLAAGATLDQDVQTTDAGDQLAMLRDPWGLPIQLVKRATPML